MTSHTSTKFTACAVITVTSMLCRTASLLFMWNHFLVLAGVPKISGVVAFGIGGLFTLLTFDSGVSRTKITWESYLDMQIANTVTSLLVFGWGFAASRLL